MACKGVAGFGLRPSEMRKNQVQFMYFIVVLLYGAAGLVKWHLTNAFD